MAVAETLSDLSVGLLFAVGVAVFLGLIVLIAWMIFKKKAGFHDSMKDLFREMVVDAKINLPPHMKSLYRVHLPFISDFLNAYSQGRRLETEIEPSDDFLERLNAVLGRHRKGVYLGEIVGFNRIDMLATIEDIIMPDSKYDDVLKKVDKEELEEIKKILKEIGRFLIVIVYKPQRQPILRNREECVLAFSDQVIGDQSEDGIVALLGEGLDRLAVYFQIPSGYPHRIKMAIVYLISRSWIRLALRLESIHVESVEEAIRLDSTSQKMMMFSALQNSGGGKGGDKIK